jgi:hypothetical protein
MSVSSESVATEHTRLAWLRSLGSEGRCAFLVAFGSYTLDSYDSWTLPLACPRSAGAN